MISHSMLCSQQNAFADLTRLECCCFEATAAAAMKISSRLLALTYAHLMQHASSMWLCFVPAKDAQQEHS